jgi:tetratricopeptide (TPR) repeat protein
LKLVPRLAATALAAAVFIAAGDRVYARKAAPAVSPSPSASSSASPAANSGTSPAANSSASPSASSSASPAPLPTASPEPAQIAIPRLEAKLKANPNDQESLQQLSGYYLGENRPDLALGLTQRLLSLGAKTAQVYYLDGLSNQQLGREPAATSDFEEATNREPTNPQILLTLTDLYLRENRASDAERVAKRATTFNATDPRVFENYGLVLAQEGKFDDARTQFEVAAKLDPKDPLPYILEARSYISQKSYALAEQNFDKALAIDPKSPDGLLGKARLQAANHDTAAAIATYETLLAIVPTDDAKASVLVEEYQAYRDEKMFDQALAILKRGELAYPNSAAIHLAYGDYDVAIAKNQAAAETEWRTALGQSRDNPDALTRLGELALTQKRASDAIGYFKRLTEVTPNDPSSWSTLAQVDVQSTTYADARDAFRHAFAIARTPQALAGVGSTDLQLGNVKECTQIFDAIDRGAEKFMQANPQLYYVYGKCALQSGDRPQALKAYTKLKPFVKPGTPLSSEVNKTLNGLRAKNSKPSAKPKSTPKPSH